MRKPILAWVVPVEMDGRPDNTLPDYDRPVDPGYGRPGYVPGYPGRPGNELPGSGGHPWFPGHIGRPGVKPPIYIPIAGRPSNPIVLPGIDNSLPPIVYPPVGGGIIDNTLPPTPGVPPLFPTNPIAGLPGAGQLPVIPPDYVSGQPIPPPSGGTMPVPPGGAERGGLPAGSVLLIPLPTDKPMPIPPGVVLGSVAYVAWGGPGTLPVGVWIPPQAAPK